MLYSLSYIRTDDRNIILLYFVLDTVFLSVLDKAFLSLAMQDYVEPPALRYIPPFISGMNARARFDIFLPPTLVRRVC